MPNLSNIVRNIRSGFEVFTDEKAREEAKQGLGIQVQEGEKTLSNIVKEIKTKATDDTSAVSQFFRPETAKQTVEEFRQIPGIKQVSRGLQALAPESEEEAFKVGMINIGTKENPTYFDVTGVVGSLRNVAKEGAKKSSQKQSKWPDSIFPEKRTS